MKRSLKQITSQSRTDELINIIIKESFVPLNLLVLSGRPSCFINVYPDGYRGDQDCFPKQFRVRWQIDPLGGKQMAWGQIFLFIY